MNIQEVIAYYTDTAQAQAIDERYATLLNHLDSFSQAPVIKSEQDYFTAQKAKKLLCALSVYTSNTKHPDNQRVWHLENVYGEAMEKYNRSILIKDKDTKLVARYLAWTRYFTTDVDHIKVLHTAADLGVLRKTVSKLDDGGERIRLFVVGLKHKVGDNTFTPDRLGREHRNYVETIGRQAIPVTVPTEAFIAFTQDKAALAKIETLHDSYYVTNVCDRKGCIRAIPFGNQARLDVCARFGY
ncbi:hypothetical protein [Vibrio sp. Hal054]|uniref:hypothetical protein n=1 Tax=Vibrio sp. Hal054 TaxID=3035158 RepID=UPI00301DE93D